MDQMRSPATNQAKENKTTEWKWDSGAAKKRKKKGKNDEAYT